ncbi:hypothetical protein, partial [Novosphingobium aquae]
VLGIKEHGDPPFLLARNCWNDGLAREVGAALPSITGDCDQQHRATEFKSHRFSAGQQPQGSERNNEKS